MKFLFFLALSLFCGAMYAQQNLNNDCDQEALKNLPGKWTPQGFDEVENNMRKPTAAEAAAAKKIFNQIGKLFQEKYKPMGVDVNHYLTHNISPEGKAYSNWYIYTLSNSRFICVNGKKTTNSEAVSSAVHINPEGSLSVKFREMPVYDESSRKVSSEASGSFGFYALTERECKNGNLPDLSNGYYVVETSRDYNVWVTQDGKLPYRYVSRKEFIEKQVKLLEAQRKERHPGDSKELLTAFFDKPLKAYKLDLKKDEEWLREISIVRQEVVKDPVTNAFQYSRFGFTTLNDPAMSVPIMPNPGYYNKNLPKWAPQFIVINVGRIDGFIGQNIRKVVDENIEYFKSLLVNN